MGLSFAQPTKRRPEQDDPFGAPTYQTGQTPTTATPSDGGMAPLPSFGGPENAMPDLGPSFGAQGSTPSIESAPADVPSFQTPAKGAAPTPQELSFQTTGTRPVGAAPGQAQPPSKWRSHVQAIDNARDPRGRAVAQDALARDLSAQLTAAGHKVAWKGDTLTVDGREYVLGSGQGQSLTPDDEYPVSTPEMPGVPGGPDDVYTTPGEVGPTMPGSGGLSTPPGQAPGPDPIEYESGKIGAASVAGFNPTAPTYTPGEVPDLDITGMTFPEIMQAIGGDQQFTSDVQAAIQRILNDPHSLGEDDIARMKAAVREKAIQLGADEDEALQFFGQSMGLTDSRWLASERLGARRSRDESVIRGTGDVEMQAMATNKADELRAAEMASSFLFQSNEDRRQAVGLAADTHLRSAAAAQDRMAFREFINQRATELGQSADQIMLSYTLGILDDASRRYGIDVSSAMDRDRLAQQDRQFLEEMALAWARFLAEEDQRGIDNYMNVPGPGGGGGFG